nr:ankyrin repeat domain-containing protein [Acanthopleuribacter pedis]
MESTPQLAWAINHGDLELTVMALEGGADVNGLVPGEDMPLLVLAANQGHHRIVSQMLAHGADFEQGDRFGFLAIHHAVANNDEEMLALFLRAGADPFRKGDMGFSAVDMAHNFRHHHLVELMNGKSPTAKALLP